MRAVIAGLFCMMVSPVALADPALPRVIAAARTSPLLPSGRIDHAAASCDTALCFAQTLAAALPDRVRLEPVKHPDTDDIRWVTTTPSVIAVDAPESLQLKFTHFGRKVATELRQALIRASKASPPPVGTHHKAATSVTVDLRGHAGGDFERMLDVAGLLIGPRENILVIDYGDHVERRSLQGSRESSSHIIRVLTDQQTASAALLLARLLAGHAGAAWAGPEDTGEPIILKRRIPVDHDWRLVLPVASVYVARP